MDDRSYALGMNTGMNLFGSGIDGISVRDFSKGMSDILESKKTRITPEEMRSLVAAAYSDAEKVRTDRLKENANEWMLENSGKPDVVCCPSGLQYRVIGRGDGIRPGQDDDIECHCVMKVNGMTVLMDTRKLGNGDPVEVNVGKCNQGLKEGISRMREGSRYELFIPWNLAYGADGIPGKIAPYSNLVVDIEIMKVLKEE